MYSIIGANDSLELLRNISVRRCNDAFSELTGGKVDEVESAVDEKTDVRHRIPFILIPLFRRNETVNAARVGPGLDIVNIIVVYTMQLRFIVRREAPPIILCSRQVILLIGVSVSMGWLALSPGAMLTRDKM